VTERRLGPAERVAGEVTVPGDKSISHRALILGALARGRSFLGNLSPAADVASTAACLGACGAWLRRFGEDRVVLDGDGVGRSLHSPEGVLDCGNSGTTMRLLSGVLAGHPVEATLDGDASLRRRPMRRVAVPLERMGAEVEPSPEGTAPIRVRGRHPLRAVEYALPVASAQLKSAVLLAGLSADGPTTVVEPAPSRDHTERLLRLCEVEVDTHDGRVTVVPGELRPFGLRIPGDLSSAAFLLALAASRPGWRVRCPGVTLNPGRTGILDVLREMGAGLAVEALDPAGGVEPVGDVEVRGAHLRAVSVGGEVVPRVIDELPVLAVLASQAEGTTEIHDAAELRAKESDRIAAVAAGLRALGAECEEAPDGLTVGGPVRLRPALLDSHGDHRLAMAWAVAACLAGGDGLTTIRGADCVGVSYPRFFDDLARVTGGAGE
jgi:3-phosphoshikimate 1-carboxyvinyltransferase